MEDSQHYSVDLGGFVVKSCLIDNHDSGYLGMAVQLYV